MGNEMDAFQEAVIGRTGGSFGIIDATVGKGFSLPYIETAFEDCSDRVFELVSGGSRAGFEIELLPPGYVYSES